MKEKIIVISGPTASGKTDLAIQIARAVSGEIISADSMQIYRGMDIATAAPGDDELKTVPFHLVKFLSPGESFSVSDFVTLARQKISRIISRGNVPIVCGGTGLFIDSLVDNIQFTDIKTDPELRNNLLQKDNGELFSELEKIDPFEAKKVHPSNKKRVVRALEIYYLTGKTKTEADSDSKKQGSIYKTLYLYLTFKDRQKLYDRINSRVDKMMTLGLVEEARRMLPLEKGTSSQAIGHKELLNYFSGEESLESAVENIKKETRHYAKRQISWFNRRHDAIRLESDVSGPALYEKAMSLVTDFLNEK